MDQYKALARGLLADCAAKARRRGSLTQDAMAENLRITSRAHGDFLK